MHFKSEVWSRFATMPREMQLSFKLPMLDGCRICTRSASEI